MNSHVLFAVFKRNFVSYFANPTGYLFICVFVLLCSASAFWPPDFFNNNLANLDQLSWGIQILGFRFGFSIIMLVFIPSITMGMWADERRQGTDELLLTIPVSDFDIVLGKYLAAVAIFSVSLLFSLICNFTVLQLLGDPDFGLFLGTYFGYWLIGLAMLAVGMVASFLTSNLTISYILGALFNAPLVFASASDVLFGPKWAGFLKSCSIGGHFADFGRGVISLSSVVYFAALAAVMLYLCKILIGRRHWYAGLRGSPMVLHYIVRVIALAAIVAGATFFFSNHAVRWDTTADRINSLTPQTKELLREMKFQRPVKIEAFVSPEVPESYVQTRLNLLSLLREFEALGRGNLRIVVHDTELLSQEAQYAQDKYGIEPREIITKERGVLTPKKIFLYLAISSGTERIPPIFIDRGIPIEYELIRSLGTVAEKERKRIGVLTTDAQVMGRLNPMNPSASSNWPIIDELEKQYEVVSVDPAQPITEKYDVLLAVQPSSLGPEETKNFIAAVENGQPTAIFEDPVPVFMRNVPGTNFPRRPPGGMGMFMGARPPAKGNLRPLWEFLGVDYTGNDIVYQKYNPYPKSQYFPPELVIVDQGQYAGLRHEEIPQDKKEKEKVEKAAAHGRNAFNPNDVISSGLQQILLPYPGLLSKLHVSDFEFIPLVKTGTATGIVRVHDVLQMSPFGGAGRLNPHPRRQRSGAEYVMAAEIRGKAPSAPPAEETPAPEDKPAENKDEKKTAPKETEIHVVLVPDIDMLYADFFRLREMGSDNPDSDINYSFDNVTFILNVLDALAGGDNRYIAIRKHRPQHRTIERVEKRAADKKLEVADARDKFYEKYEEKKKKLSDAVRKKIEELRNRKDVNPQQMLIEVSYETQVEQSRLEQDLEAERRQRDRKIDQIETSLEQFKQQVRNRYKLWAVLLPPILPLVIGLAVFFTRRSREKEGVDRARLRP